VALRGRPSFPTRRSSDLARAGSAGDRRGIDGRVAAAEGAMRRRRRMLAVAALAAVASGPAGRAADTWTNTAGSGSWTTGSNWLEDRKSTRLNSSHVAISY